MHRYKGRPKKILSLNQKEEPEQKIIVVGTLLTLFIKL